MPVSTPVVEMVEIGAGGGSIASIDAMGRIQVGPRSAGLGTRAGLLPAGRHAKPTVTDANLILGRLDPDGFAGGAKSRSTPGLSARPCNAADASAVWSRCVGGGLRA